MRRIAFTVAATMLVAAAVPASALAHHHHARHHARSHHAKIRRFGDQTTAPTSTNSADNAGTVQSFTGGVLTIALNDGTVVSGKVTEQTEVNCGSSGGDDQGSGDDQNEDQAGSTFAHQSDFQSGDDDQGDDDNQEGCSTSSLEAGKKVAEAELVLTGSGAVWKSVELIP